MAYEPIRSPQALLSSGKRRFDKRAYDLFILGDSTVGKMAVSLKQLFRHQGTFNAWIHYMTGGSYMDVANKLDVVLTKCASKVEQNFLVRCIVSSGTCNLYANVHHTEISTPELARIDGSRFMQMILDLCNKHSRYLKVEILIIPVLPRPGALFVNGNMRLIDNFNSAMHEHILNSSSVAAKYISFQTLDCLGIFSTPSHELFNLVHLTTVGSEKLATAISQNAAFFGHNAMYILNAECSNSTPNKKVRLEETVQEGQSMVSKTNNAAQQN